MRVVNEKAKCSHFIRYAACVPNLSLLRHLIRLIFLTAQQAEEEKKQRSILSRTSSKFGASLPLVLQARKGYTSPKNTLT